MQHDQHAPVAGLIELGRASLETRGSPIGLEQEAVGFRPEAITED